MTLTSDEARALASKNQRHFTEAETETALMAVVAWGGNAAAAQRYLAAEKDIEISVTTLCDWKRRYAIRYDEIREKYSGQLEEQLGHEFREGAMEALGVQRMAVGRARERLESGEEADPARAAANLARVAQSNVDKLMTMTSRPSKITESRNPEEIIRALVGLGVIKVGAEAAEIPEATEEPKSPTG